MDPGSALLRSLSGMTAPFCQGTASPKRKTPRRIGGAFSVSERLDQCALPGVAVILSTQAMPIAERMKTTWISVCSSTPDSV